MWWQLLTAVLALLPIDPIVATKLAGIVCGALSLLVLTRLTRRLVGDDPLTASIPALLLT